MTRSARRGIKKTAAEASERWQMANTLASRCRQGENAAVFVKDLLMLPTRTLRTLVEELA